MLNRTITNKAGKLDHTFIYGQQTPAMINQISVNSRIFKFTFERKLQNAFIVGTYI